LKIKVRLRTEPKRVATNTHGLAANRRQLQFEQHVSESAIAFAGRNVACRGNLIRIDFPSNEEDTETLIPVSSIFFDRLKPVIRP